mmetsp:Transcript_5647/g.19235  ORF Transcript_5647/g.19235 Transcript_5647/m.19235 type:complete len:294 (-) Transcript_5647:838-1719(-)
MATGGGWPAGGAQSTRHRSAPASRRGTRSGAAAPLFASARSRSSRDVRRSLATTRCAGGSGRAQSAATVAASASTTVESYAQSQQTTTSTAGRSAGSGAPQTSVAAFADAPLAARFLARRPTWRSTSVARTSQPSFARTTDSRPVPAPSSRIFAPGPTRSGNRSPRKQRAQASADGHVTAPMPPAASSSNVTTSPATSSTVVPRPQARTTRAAAGAGGAAPRVTSQSSMSSARYFASNRHSGTVATASPRAAQSSAKRAFGSKAGKVRCSTASRPRAPSPRHASRHATNGPSG